AIVHFDLDRLVAAVTANIVADFVPALHKLARRLIRYSTFQLDIAAFFHLFTGWFAVPFMLPARSVACFLHVETEINLVSQYLDMTLRLHATTHDSKCFPRLAILHPESRNNRVKWAFPRSVTFAWPDS